VEISTYLGRGHVLVERETLAHVLVSDGFETQRVSEAAARQEQLERHFGVVRTQRRHNFVEEAEQFLDLRSTDCCCR